MGKIGPPRESSAFNPENLKFGKHLGNQRIMGQLGGGSPKAAKAGEAVLLSDQIAKLFRPGVVLQSGNTVAGSGAVETIQLVRGGNEYWAPAF